MAGLPTIGTVSAELTTSGVTATIDSTCRGLYIVGFLGSNTSAAHTLATISIGGLSFTFHHSGLNGQVHCCGYYLANIAGRSNNVITITGWTMGSAVNQYRWRYANILHPTSLVSMVNGNSNGALANGGTFLVSLAPGAGVQARAIAMCNVQSVSSGATGASGFTTPTTHFSDVAGPTGTSHEKWGNSGTITGTTSVGWTMGSGSNQQRAGVGTAWAEGAPLVTPSKGRIWALGALPEIALPLLGHGLVAARVVPWAS